MDYPEPKIRNKSIARKKKIENQPIYGQKKIREMERKLLKPSGSPKGVKK